MSSQERILNDQQALTVYRALCALAAGNALQGDIVINGSQGTRHLVAVRPGGGIALMTYVKGRMSPASECHADLGEFRCNYELPFAATDRVLFRDSSSDSDGRPAIGTVLRPLTEAEADLFDVGPMYRLLLDGGDEKDAFDDELSPLPWGHMGALIADQARPQGGTSGQVVAVLRARGEVAS